MSHVLILGAGSSCPYDFPSGIRLIDQVEMSLSELFPSGRYGRGGTTAEIFRKEINEGSFVSIDNYLRYYPRHSEKIKASIFHSILNSENEGNLFNDHSKNPKWYSFYFSNLMPDAERIFELPAQHIITFNYDRSLEFFLFNYIKARCRSKLQENGKESELNKKVFELLHEKFKIDHVYGRLPNLPGESFFPGANPISYGKVNNEDLDFTNLGKNHIRTIYEEQKSESIINIKTILSSAKIIYLLGCGMHPENLQLLGLPYEGKLIESTNFELPRTIARKATADFFVSFPDTNASIGCYEFWRDYNTPEQESEKN